MTTQQQSARGGLYFRCLPAATEGLASFILSVFPPAVAVLVCVLLPGILRAQTVSTSPADVLFTAPDTANFGLTRVRLCDTLRLPLVNNAAEPIVLDSVRFLSAPASPFPFTVDEVSGLLVQPGEKTEVRIGFCAGDTTCAAARLVLYIRSAISVGEPVVHTIGIGGCGGAPFVAVERGKDTIAFGAISVQKCGQERFSLRNTGNYPLRIISLAGADPAFRVVDPPLFPVTLPPHSSRDIAVQFCPSDTGTFLDSLLVVSDADNPPPTVYLSGNGSVRRFHLPALFDVGSVLLGMCVDTFLVVENTGSEVVTFTDVRFSSLPTSNGFFLANQLPAGWMKTLLPQDTAHLPLRFCPVTAGVANTFLEIVDEHGESSAVPMRGEGIIPLLRLDTADAEAGRVATLTFRVDPPYVVDPGSFQVRFTFNSDALFPVGVAPTTAGGTAVMSVPVKGELVVSGDFFTPLPSDGALFTVALRGLSSGAPTNVVKIEEVKFLTFTGAWERLDGMVRLSGCDVGRLPGVAKRAHISGLGPNPAAGSTLLTYQAPQGRAPSLTIFDFRGRIVQRLQLPEGTGELQEFRLDLAGFPRGVYTMELQERNERSWRILLVD